MTARARRVRPATIRWRHGARSARRRDSGGLRGVRARGLGDRRARPRRLDARLRRRPRTSTGGILATRTVPAHDLADGRRRGGRHRRADRRALDYVGVLAVELFVAAAARAGCSSTRSRRAFTIPATGRSTPASCSQFEQHIRAVAGWPLGDRRAPHRAVMTNLIGDEVDRLARLLAEPDAAPTPLRQGGGAARPQDGPRQSHHPPVRPLIRLLSLAILTVLSVF